MLKAQISAPLPVARGLPSTALALLAGDGGVQRPRRLTPLEMSEVGMVPAVVRVQDKAAVGPAVGSMDERVVVGRRVVKGSIRLDGGDGLDGERRDTMFGDFTKTPPDTPRSHEAARARRADRGKSRYRLMIFVLPNCFRPNLDYGDLNLTVAFNA